MFNERNQAATNDSLVAVNFNVSQQFVNSFFEKKFKFKKLEWNIPTSEFILQTNQVPTKIETLQELKVGLNSVKSKLNDYPIESWSAHTRRRNPAGEIAWRIKNQIKAEFVTQAWCKFYECINQFPIVTNSVLNTVHLCEAPGAFIAALNHYLHSNYEDSNIYWKWLSSTLNPYHESNPLNNMVTDDRFMLYTLDRWIFGKDFTGDIISRTNIEHMAEEAKKLGSINLVTADGSIDCMETPESQEEAVSCLHFAEVCAALKILSEGGSFVLKFFTIFELESVGLLYLLNCIFREVNVYKPVTSKCGNSEMYVICIGFEKDTPNFQDCLSIMLNELDTKKGKIPPIFQIFDIPGDFLMQHEVCARMFMSRQIKVIESNIHNYENPSVYDSKRCRILRQQISNEYMTKFKIAEIPEEFTILYDRNAKVQYEFHTRIYSGSYTQRCSLNSMTYNEKLNVLQKRFEDIKNSTLWVHNEKSKILKNIEDHPIKYSLYFGKIVTKIESSLFIDIHLMHLRNKIETISPDLNEDSLMIPEALCELLSEDNIILHTIKFDTGLSSNDYGIKEKLFFSNILENLTKKVHKIIFKNIPFLTHFSVSILKILWESYFYELVISDDCTSELRSQKSSITESKYEEIAKILKDSSDLLCLADIKDLHKNLFSDTITDLNNQIFIKILSELFSQ